MHATQALMLLACLMRSMDDMTLLGAAALQGAMAMDCWLGWLA